jgi:hypothetical protein
VEAPCRWPSNDGPLFCFLSFSLHIPILSLGLSHSYSVRIPLLLLTRSHRIIAASSLEQELVCLADMCICA